MTTRHYQCKGCDEPDSIVEVSLVPRIMTCEPDEQGKPSFDNGIDEAFWESETNIGFACSNDSCRYAQYQYGLRRTAAGRYKVDRAHPIADIADVVEI